jgi:adenylate cyclase
MTPRDLKRKLTAILSADVKGYSRLMGDDEERTVRTLNAYKEVIRSLVSQHRGRVVDAPGDNLLAEFASVVDSVQCAVEIQQALKAKNALLPENRRMEFRVGINLGDVIEEGDAIYGDGVNIAARIEGLAPPGGICVSGSAYEQVENKLPLQYEYLGEHEVKNIAKPVKVYRAQIEPEAAPSTAAEEEKHATKRMSKAALGIIALLVLAGAVILYQFVLRPSFFNKGVASRERMALPLPDKPSIAVLPFTYTSGDPAHEYLSDGITDAVITALAKSSQLFIIGRTSTLTYKGKPVKFQKVSEELGVRYVLEGSVQLSGGRLRVAAQLIDALSGYHLFSERYDRELKDIFATQDDITMKVFTATRVALTQGEEARVFGKGTRNLEAYLKVLQAQEHHELLTKESQALARQLAEEAIALDPGYALAYSYAAMSIAHAFVLGAYANPREELERGMKLVQKAVALDPSLAHPHEMLSKYYIYLYRDYERGIAEAEHAVALEPNSVDAYVQLGSNLRWAGRGTEAIPVFQKAIRLSPIAPYLCLAMLAGCYYDTGQYEQAIALDKQILRKEPNQLITQLGLTAALVRTGREDEARAEAAKVLRIDPSFSVESHGKRLPFKDQARTDDLVSAYRKAGLK